jgi:RNA-binding protein
MNKDMKELKARSNLLEPSLIMGKNGLTDNTIKAIKNLLKSKKLIKVKILKSCIEGKDKKELFNEIAKKTDSILVHKVGFVIVLYKKE